MRLYIELFRKYENFELVLSDGTITLLSGNSGCGKSTIFEAISWVLYGDLRLISNFERGAHHGCRVVLEHNGYLITRKTKSKLLTVEYTDHTGIERRLIDQEGEGLLRELFGDKLMYRLTSYIPQDCYHPLLTASNHERLTFLHRLSFSDDDDPAIMIDVIKQQLKQLDKKYDIALQAYKDRVSEFTRELQLLPGRSTAEQKNSIEAGSLTDRLLTIREEIDLVEKRLEETLKIEGRLHYTQERLKVLTPQHQQLLLKHQSIDYDVNVDVVLPLYETQYEDYLRLQKDRQSNEKQLMVIERRLVELSQVLARLSQFEEELAALRDKLDGKKLIHYTELEFAGLADNWQRYQRATAVCQRYGIEYTVGGITKAKFESERISALKPKLSSYELYRRLLAQPEEMGLESTVTDLTTQLQELRKQQQLLICPQCQKGLYYRDRLLYRAERERPPTADEIAMIDTKLAVMRTRLKEQQERKVQLNTLSNFLNDSLDLLQKYPTNLIEQYVLAQKDLLGINYEERPTITLEEGHERVLLTKLDQKRQQYEKAMSLTNRTALGEEHLQLSLEANRLKALLREHNTIDGNSLLLTVQHWRLQRSKQQQKAEVQQDLFRMEQQLDELQREVNALVIDPTLKERHKELMGEEQRLLQSQLHQEQWLVVNRRRTGLEDDRAQLEVMRNELIALKELYRNASLVQCNGLEDTVRGLNVALEDIMGAIMEKGIQVRLELYKKMKANHRIKPIVNMMMRYNGVEVDRIDSLSKGELKRVSLAFIIAINELTANPLIMLDELTAYLDADSLEESLTVLRLRLKGHGKTIICSSHRDSEGNYDQVKRLE